MIVGAILQATSFSYAQMLVARVVTGLGNGLNVGAVPLPIPDVEIDANILDINSSNLPCRMLSCSQTRKSYYARGESDHVWNNDLVSP